MKETVIQNIQVLGSNAADGTPPLLVIWNLTVNCDRLILSCVTEDGFSRRVKTTYLALRKLGAFLVQTSYSVFSPQTSLTGL